MEDRIEIPTSEPQGDSPRRKSSAGLAGIAAAVVIIAAFAFLGAERDPIQETSGEIVGFEQADGASRFEDLVVLPGNGRVTSLSVHDGELHAFASTDHGTAIWRLSESAGEWQVVDGLPGVTITASAEVEGVLWVAGFDVDTEPLLAVWGPDGVGVLDSGLGRLEVPVSLSATSDRLLVFSQSGLRQPGGAGSVRTTTDGRTFIEIELGANAFATGVGEIDDRAVVLGSLGGSPAVWEFSGDSLVPTVLPGPGVVLDVEVGTDGSALALTVDSSVDPLRGTRRIVEFGGTGSVELGAGVWNALLASGGRTYVLPDGAPPLLVSSDGTAWSRLVSANRLDEAADGAMVVSTGIDFGGPVVGGALSSLPALAAESAPDEVAPLVGEWRVLEQLDSGVSLVWNGEIQVAVQDEVVVTRAGLGDTWRRPVFADEASVAGIEAVAELECGQFLLAVRPYRALWYSDDGRTYSLIARDVTGLAGNRTEVVFEVDDGVRRLVATSCGEPDRLLGPVPTGSRLEGWVRDIGYVLVGREALFATDGADWMRIEVPPHLEGLPLETSINPEGLAIGTAGSWYRWAGTRFEPVSSPVPGETDRRTTMIEFFGYVMQGDEGRLWVTADLTNWIEVSLGVWRGVDADFISGLWIEADRVVAQLTDQPGTTPVRTLAEIDR